MKPIGSYSRITATAVKSTIAPLLFILIFAVVATSIVSYQLSIRQLKSKVQHLGTEHSSHMEKLLWHFDLEGIESELANFIDLAGIQRVTITDSTGQIIEKQRPAIAGKTVSASFPLSHEDGLGNTIALGEMTIEANRQEAWSTARRRALALVTISALSILTMFVLIIRSINRSVLAPLVTISNRLRSSPKDMSSLTLDLRSTALAQPDDELDELVDSINEMRNQILSERRSTAEREKWLAQAAQLAGLAYCTMDPAFTRIVECDETYAAMHRKTVNEMLTLNLWTDIVEKMVDKIEISRALSARERIMKGNNEIQTFRIQFDNDDFRYIRQYFAIKRDVHGEIEAIQVVAQDVTEDMLTRDILLQTQKTEAIGKLTGGVAHDFNNILAIISGNLEMLAKYSDSPEFSVHHKTAMEAVTRGSNLTSQLLSFARKQPLSPVVVNADKLVRDSSTLLRTSVRESIDLEILCDSSIWNFKADPLQLDAVLLNLVVNASDAMPLGGILRIEFTDVLLDEVRTGAHVEVSAGSYVCIAVIDSGYGMSTETSTRAIEPFFTTKANGHGTGLGLSMAYGFAIQSGGHMKISSSVGSGTAVRLYLPRVLDSVPDAPKESIQKIRINLSGLHVVLIEDNEQLRTIIAAQIQSLGGAVHEAFDKSSALALTQTVPHVDVILSDLVLPGDSNGQQIAEQLASFYPDVRTVFMSGFIGNSNLQQKSWNNEISVLQKPFKLNELAQRLAKAVETDTVS